MGRVWVLDTETKGTGAQMVPLDQVLEKPAPRGEPLFVPPRRREPEPEAPAPRAPRRFRILDVETRAVLADDVPAGDALRVLGAARSSVDVQVYVWEPKGDRWRLLTLPEQRVMWDRRQGLT